MGTKLRCLYSAIASLKDTINIANIADSSLLGEHIPHNLRDWGNKDFQYDSDINQFLRDAYENDPESIADFINYLIDSLPRHIICRRHDSINCALYNEKYYDYNNLNVVCPTCNQFLENNILRKLTKCANELGYYKSEEGFFEFKLSQGLSVEHIVSKIQEDTTVTKNLEAIVPSDLIEKSKEMAEVYTLVYCIENSLRLFIDKRFKEEHGENYLDKIAIVRGLSDKLKNRKADEEKHKWLSLRGGNDLFYFDLEDFSRLIERNWSVFEKDFPELHWITAKITEIAKCRNLIAHNSYVGHDEKVLLSLYYKQILKQISIN
ncbi:Hypothetical protein Mbur_1866 [Methanococcoides burtonii DSM 6242]|uniref:Swt1-like HEPN domain-containing protein n=1 Tax=Methanococcoides burtonii (strain DSM 6242 / NBRC 107633 / OCM 468 / ACE-M) TaxID=259564 RepID=Q12UX7_METBU|nr:Hypothetical protein Mbur_1866 [Methanococcoides burtonii DSM 6242]